MAWLGARCVCFFTEFHRLARLVFHYLLPTPEFGESYSLGMAAPLRAMRSRECRMHWLHLGDEKSYGAYTSQAGRSKWSTCSVPPGPIDCRHRNKYRRLFGHHLDEVSKFVVHVRGIGQSVGDFGAEHFEETLPETMDGYFDRSLAHAKF